MEQRRGLLADQVDAARVVDVVDVAPADAFRPVFLLQGHTIQTSVSVSATFSNTLHPRTVDFFGCISHVAM